LESSYYEGGAYGEKSDFPGRPLGAIYITQEVKNVFENILGENVEYLPIETPIGLHYIFNITNVLDCIDKKNSLEKKYISGGIMGYQEYAFFEDKLKDQHIFRVYSDELKRVMPEIFISDELRNTILENNFTGYQLVEMWDSECSWQEKSRKLDEMKNAINESLTDTFSFHEGIELVQDKNIVVYSGEWAIRLNENKEVVIGELLLDGSYSWFNPTYYPPVLLGLKWGMKKGA
jgi:hypothetical protein